MSINIEKPKNILCIDVGGSHVCGKIFNTTTQSFISEEHREFLNPQGSLEELMAAFCRFMDSYYSADIQAISFAMPGPFDYEEGIAKFRGVGKFDSLYGVCFTYYFQGRNKPHSQIPFYYLNDAAAFGLGEYYFGAGKGHHRPLTITLGTGIGASFIADGKLQKNGKGIPDGGEIYHKAWRDGIADDYFSTRRLINDFHQLTNTKVASVKDILSEATEPTKKSIFDQFGIELGQFLAPIISESDRDVLLIGGGISKNYELFISSLTIALNEENIHIPIKLCQNPNDAPLYGAAMGYLTQEK